MSALVAQTISNGSVSTSSANVIQGSAKAWVNFNGVNAAIRASYNISSVIKTGTGSYTINLTNAMSDTGYAILQWNNGWGVGWYDLPTSTSSFTMKVVNNGFSFYDTTSVSVSVLR